MHGERAMRCCDCGKVWFSAVAELVVGRFGCVSCGGPLHLERRQRPDRRDDALAAAS